jgi:hypothetical protein
MKNIIFFRSVLVIGLLFLSQAVMAQLPPDPPAEPVPIDGGLSLLIAAGAALGGKKYWDARKQKQNPAE